MEWLTDGLPVILELEDSFRERSEVRKVIRSENLALEDREIDFDLI